MIVSINGENMTLDKIIDSDALCQLHRYLYDILMVNIWEQKNILSVISFLYEQKINIK